jgi:hypothetical protein
MRFLFSSPNRVDVDVLSSLLAGANVTCEIRNENISALFPGAPFQTELWVINDADFAKAAQIREGLRVKDSDPGMSE